MKNKTLKLNSKTLKALIEQQFNKKTLTEAIRSRNPGEPLFQVDEVSTTFESSTVDNIVSEFLDWAKNSYDENDPVAGEYGVQQWERQCESAADAFEEQVRNALSQIASDILLRINNAEFGDGGEDTFG